MEEWVVDFRWPFGPREVREWDQLLAKLDPVRLNDQKDKAVWKLESKGQYTTRLMYRFLTFRGVNDRRAAKLWKNKLPMKIRVFLRQTFHNRLPTGLALKSKMYQLPTLWGAGKH
uniref:Reverse transcriptase zinc-binding domain-containing protein n=1 Tax=Setaria viridis TaxID=4556 RepID=A0A4U6UG78_SETVI|nr:hypothetical protein SEVIR_5G209000v2 [Setaria viridis]